MGPVVEIDDPADPRLADYRSLTDVALRTKFEPPHGLFIAEGALVIERAIEAGYVLRSAVMTPQWLDRTAPALETSDAPVYLGSDEVLHALTGFHVHRGALASVHRRQLPGFEDLLARCRRLVVVEDLVNHTNLGAIFRAAAALGMDGAVLSPQSADPLYRRSVRVSMGAVFGLPYARAPRWPEAIGVIQAHGFRALALTPAADAVSLAAVAAGPTERVAVVLGTEGAGLSDRAAAACDERVRIPMMAGIDSLNVAAAAAVAFWELGLRA
ncbi:MAG: RNA methyltransferase [Frankiaceae bacterium]|nr:RNA methyltransferase [Frankiaceae bacterium]MBV9871217.1 RNA methyltransferase [Frankiaceae bacterium]